MTTFLLRQLDRLSIERQDQTLLRLCQLRRRRLEARIGKNWNKALSSSLDLLSALEAEIHEDKA